MRIFVLILVAATFVAMISSCESWSWPPYEDSLRDLFVAEHSSFESIRENMLNDDLTLMSSAHARGTNRIRAGLNPPILSDELQTKYADLVEERSAFRYEVSDDVFLINLYIPPAQGRRFTFWYVRGELDALTPACAESESRVPACGSCFEPLDRDWSMYWYWSPKDRIKGDESCGDDVDDA